MRNSGNILVGVILITAGVLWLLKSLGVMIFNWSDILSYWYWYLIVAGLLLIVSGVTHNKFVGGFSGIFITLAIIGGFTHGFQREIRKITPFGNYKYWEKSNRKKGSKPVGEPVNKIQVYELPEGLKSSKLSFGAGAGEFNISGGATRLFEAEVASNFANYVSKYTENIEDKTASISFDLKKADLDSDDDNGDNDNRVNVKLNDSVDWDLNLNFGAGEGNFDFSNTPVKNLELNTGAADVKLKLGDKTPESRLNIRAGVASVTVLVPKTAAVEIRPTGALNSTELPGFKRHDKNVYRSDDYDETRNKITIRYKAGLSSIRIERYE